MLEKKEKAHLENCEECGNTINRLDQGKGYYVIYGNDVVCSQDCLVKFLGEETFKVAEEEWENEGDSDIYYWSYDE